MRSVLAFIAVMFLFSITIGCSSGMSPIEPELKSVTPERITIDSLPVGVADIPSDGSARSGMGALGIFQAHIDAETLTGELIPVRTAHATDVLEVVDITDFMTTTPCNDCVRMKSVALDYAGNVLLEIGIRHPFPAADPTIAASKSNRADLHVFNVEGTIFGESGASASFPGIGETVDTFLLINADGYSKYLDPIIDTTYPTTATIHPYILHFDDYSDGNFDAANPMGFESVTDPPPSGNLVMPMGSDFDYKIYKFSYPSGGTLDFTYVVGCTFGLSSEDISTSLEPVYRVPQFNKKAASEISVEITDWSYVAGDTGSTVTIQINAKDVNAGVAVGTALDQMAHDSSIARVQIDVPGLMTVPIDVSNPTTNEFILTNTAGGTLSMYPALIKVIDSYPTGANESTALTGFDGLSGDLFAIDEFATYYAFILREPGAAPECVITTTPTDLNIDQGTQIDFDATGSSDDGSIVEYEWDFDYDGVTFTTEASGATVGWFLCELGTNTVALRLTDNEANESICTVDVTVTGNTGPIDSWGTDIPVTSSTLDWEPFILNTSNRAVAVWKNDLYIVANNNIPLGKSENIYFIVSHDLGETWNAPVKITNYADADEAWTREANLVVDDLTGDVYITYQSDHLGYKTTGVYKYDVFMLRLHDSLTAKDGPIRINSQASGTSDQLAGSIAIDNTVSPLRIYASYNDRTSSSDFNVMLATATLNDLQIWTEQRVDDDDTKASQHPSIYVNPIDHSVNVAWVDPRNLSGSGRVLFDRSTDNGTTWGEDVVIHVMNVNTGPYETCLAINPVNGIAGVMWREVSTSEATCKHYFANADSDQGTVWNEPVSLSGTPTKFCWAGTLEVTASGRWLAVFEKDTLQTSDWKAVFTESTDDGLTWTEPVQIDDSNWVFGLSMALDDCGSVHVVWGDIRGNEETNVLYCDTGL